MPTPTTSADRYRCRHPTRLAGLGALLLLTLIATSSTTVHGQGVLLLQVSGYVLQPPSERGQTGNHIRETAAQWCNDNGAALIADSRTEITGRIVTSCVNNYGGFCTTVLDGSAKPPEDGRTWKCVEDVFSTNMGSNSFWCTYRWRLGFYDIFSEIGGTAEGHSQIGYASPGLCYFKSMFIASEWNANPTQAFCNGFIQPQIWNGTTQLNSNQVGCPHGKYFTVGGVCNSAYARTDSTELLNNNDPNPYSSYSIFCYLQDYPLPALSTSRMPQPRVIPGYKELTWAQEHWWVIFLIIAAILLLLLLFIIIYCCLAARKAPELPPIAGMVQRERDGRLYGELDDDDKSRGLPEEDDTPPPAPKQRKRSLPPVMPPMTPGPSYGSLYGVQPIDPEDLIQGTPQIFEQEDTMLTSEHGSFADSETTRSETDSD